MHSNLYESYVAQCKNPLKSKGVNWLHFAIQIKPIFLISDIRALRAECQSAKMSEIKM